MNTLVTMVLVYFVFNGENFTDETYSMGIAFIGDCTANDKIAINSTGTRATASNAEQPNIRHPPSRRTACDGDSTSLAFLVASGFLCRTDDIVF